MPPGKRIGPAWEPDRIEKAAVVGDPISITHHDKLPYARRTRPARMPFCVADVERTRRLARLHDDLHREMYPPTPRVPSTFSLEPDQLRHEANRLHGAGWSVLEIESVLDVTAAVQR